MFLLDCILSLHAFLFLLSGCNLSNLWIPEVMGDLLSSCPYFMVHHIFYFIFFWSRCNLFDLWIPEAIDDLL
jgi:hypothetical protein